MNNWIGPIVKHVWNVGRGGGQVVSRLAFYSDDPSSNPAEAYTFFLQNLCLERWKNKKMPGLVH